VRRCCASSHASGAGFPALQAGIPLLAETAGPVAQTPEPEVIEVAGFNYVGQSLTEFARCIREGVPYPISAEDVVHGVAVLEAASQSAASRKPVQLSD